MKSQLNLTLKWSAVMASASISHAVRLLHTPPFLEVHSLVVYPVSLIRKCATAAVWVPGDAGTGNVRVPV